MASPEGRNRGHSCLHPTPSQPLTFGGLIGRGNAGSFSSAGWSKRSEYSTRVTAASLAIPRGRRTPSLIPNSGEGEAKEDRGGMQVKAHSVPSGSGATPFQNHNRSVRNTPLGQKSKSKTQQCQLTRGTFPKKTLVTICESSLPTPCTPTPSPAETVSSRTDTGTQRGCRGKLASKRMT